MDKKSIYKKALPFLVAMIASIIFSFWLSDENAAQFISVLATIIIGAYILVINLENAGARQIILMGAPILSSLLKFFENFKISQDLCSFYNIIIGICCDRMGAEHPADLGVQTSLILTFWIVFCGIALVIKIRSRNAKNNSKTSNLELKEKNFAEKSAMFCRALRQKLEAINRKTDWNESLFTPIEAEIEACINGKHKKKYDDLLKCLKKNKRNKTVFLVLGDPGSGKSVSLRKLCLDLIDESNKSKQIPVYVDLKKWNKDWNINNLPDRKVLIDFVKSTLYEDGDISTDEFLGTYFDKMLEDGRWYFIFDSFDEMPCLMGKQNCQELIDHISSLLYQFLTSANQEGGIIASRLYRSPSEALGATITLRIQEFSDIKIKIMLQKYLNSSKEVVKKLFGNREDLVVLCRNPFYLTLLINYVRENSMDFPTNQMELYDNFVKGRLERCSEKISSENLTVEKIHEAAKKLAVYMQQSSKFGLECPAKRLYEKGDENYWRNVLGLLAYAKICRFGGSNETVSFVHRRFQEFFLVESVIENKDNISHEEYNSIVNNSGMRDALILYCEIADDNKVKEIAEFCWNVVKENINQNNNILNPGCLALVNTLYFMAEAFRNKKSALTDFLENFEELVENNLNRDTDFVALHALTNSMVLFEQERLQQMVLKVFKLKNRWLADLVIKNCRVMKRLGSRIESKFCDYFKQQDYRTFFERFRNTQFSLSLSKSFRYVRSIHFSIFLTEIFLTFTVFLTIIAIIILSLSDIQGIPILDNWPSLEIVADSSNYFVKLSQQYEIFNIIINSNHLFIVFNSALYLSLISNSKGKHNLLTRLVVLVVYSMSFAFSMVIKHFKYFPGFIWISIFSLVLAINLLVPIIHDVYYSIKERRFKIPSIDLKHIIILVSVIAIICILIYLLIILIDYYLLLKIVAIILYTILAVAIILFDFVPHLLDWYWIKHQPNIQIISREMLAKNLNTLHTKKWKCTYIDSLLQNKVILTGSWPNNTRPYSRNDELVLKLAKLDCAELDNLYVCF